MNPTPHQRDTERLDDDELRRELEADLEIELHDMWLSAEAEREAEHEDDFREANPS